MGKYSRTIIRFSLFVIILLFLYPDHHEKVREHRSLVPISAFLKRLDTRICPNHNDTSKDLPDKYNRKHLFLFKR